MLKRLVRLLIRRARNWLHEDVPVPTSIGGPAYDRLNRIFGDLLKNEQSLRPHFTWGLLYGADLAKNIGIPRISAIEFGVAGGKGLLSLERAGRAIERRLDIGIDVYGFDTGCGLPQPADYRDLPNLYRESAFQMDPEALKKKLQKAHLILGPVKETVSQFAQAAPAPVAFISFDLDYYSSTMHAFQLLERETKLLLPRVHCYFDDIFGFTFSEFTGERLAITEFNNSHQMRKISRIFGLRYFLPPPYDRAVWLEQMYLAHIFDHELYGEYDGLVERSSDNALALEPERS